MRVKFCRRRHVTSLHCLAPPLPTHAPLGMAHMRMFAKLLHSNITLRTTRHAGAVSVTSPLGFVWNRAPKPVVGREEKMGAAVLRSIISVRLSGLLNQPRKSTNAENSKASGIVTPSEVAAALGSTLPHLASPTPTVITRAPSRRRADSLAPCVPLSDARRAPGERAPALICS